MKNSKGSVPQIKTVRALLAAFLLSFVAIPGQKLISYSLISSKTPAQVNTLLNTVGAGDGINNGVDAYKISYRTTGPSGATVLATGACLVPRNTACDSLPLLSYNHGTILNKVEVPSNSYNSNVEGYYFAAKGYITSMPDYIGLGDGPGYHPFQHALTEAYSTIDMMRAVRDMLDSLSVLTSGKVFIAGYSQGGHAAMATLKFIQDSNLVSEFSVVAGAPASGAYAMSRAQTRMMGGTYQYNGFIAYVIDSYRRIYPTVDTNYDAYYVNPYDSTLRKYFNGSWSFSALNAALPTNVNAFMQPSFLTAFVPDTVTYQHPLRQALRLNDNFSWKATMPLTLCYCKGDDAINYGNSIMARDSMIAKGSASVNAVDVFSQADHFNCAYFALPYIRSWFNTLRQACTGTGTSLAAEEDFSIVVFPNPASSHILVTASAPLERITVCNLDGKPLVSSQQPFSKSADIALGTLPDGLYMVVVNDRFRRKLIIRH